MTGFIGRMLPALLIGTALSGCAYSWDEEVSGVALSELDMSGDAPSEISLAGPDEIIITQGDTFKITLDGSEEAGKALRFDRQDDSLDVARDSGIWDGKGKAIVRITMPAPNKLEIAGSGTIKSDRLGSNAELEIAGSGDIAVGKVAANSLTVEIAGSGDVKAAGKADRLTIEIAGSGNVELDRLTADDVKIEIAGSGDVNLASDGKVGVEIVGSGNVKVTGDATCAVETTGGGKVSCKPATKNASSASKDPADAE